jgi:monoamine oxidase
VLGGGLAGLAAAYELGRAGHKVTILEARKAPGGRVRTLRGFSDGLYAEAGPVSFPSDHAFTFDYCLQFGLPVRPAFRLTFDQMARIQGHRFRIPSTGSAQAPLDLTSREHQAGVFGLPSLYMGRLIRQVGNPRKGEWPPEDLRRIDSISCKQLLIDAGASAAAIELIEASALGLLGFGLDSISALSGVVTEAIANGAPFHEIAGGNDQLPQAFKSRIRGAYRKRSIVRRISQNESSVTIIFERKGSVQTITADRVVCALPFAVLKDIEIEPGLPEDKQRAIREIKLTPVTRTYQEFRSRIWEQDRLDGYSITDLIIQNTYSPTLTQGGQRGILTSYAAGQRAIDLAGLSESERQDVVLRRMSDVFGNLNKQFDSGTSYIWHEDQFARGAYTYFEPNQMTALLPVAQRPEGRIHFAGEHTSVWHGWMNGALESGNRAATEINEAESAQSINILSPTSSKSRRQLA